MKKRFAALLLAGTLAMSTLAGCGGLEDSDVMATVGKEEITGNVANFFARYQQAMYEATYSSMLGDNMWETQIEAGKSYEETTKKNIMQSLEELYLIDQHKEDYNVSLTDEEKKKISDAADAFVKGNSEEARKMISGDKETIEKILTLLTVQNKMQPEMIKDVDQNVSDEEAAQKKMQYVYFLYSKDASSEDSSAEGETDTDTKDEAKTKADAFLKAVKEGKDFSASAEEQGATASELTFDSSSQSLDEKVIKAADALKAGEMTDVIETDTGFYVARLTSDFDREATDSKKQQIIDQREQDRYDELLKEWKEDTEIKEYGKEWKKIDFVKQGVNVKAAETTEDTSENTEETTEENTEDTTQENSENTDAE
ncbi:peptidylprolyl isomerase [Sellimonas caecigallum]|uniref:Peptidyl-prolyl cis-trans isomerase n=1 Tax=Sellimonas caecigallum TaxID=2592333 RepID=A0ABS7L429_9FIRM|nr:peptidylprolyl isomerase [Sellimonas caecigallum]MBY0757794.1 peptidyl-prolyl cis-trans isomerase [Sellimonas caecigallum]